MMETLSKTSMMSEERSPRNNSSVGSISSEKMKMVDITRDKPIKVAVRVAVPVKDHPKFNFVGKLLGPKGNSMKRLQEETMCKMAVLGRGSMRDRKKEDELRTSGDPRYAHLSQDLHVEISTFAAPAEAHARIAYALAEVRRFLVPDYHDDIRQEQMWEMQVLTSSPSSTSSGQNQNTEQGSPSSQTDMETSSSMKLQTDAEAAMSLDKLSSMNTLNSPEVDKITGNVNTQAGETNSETSSLQIDISSHTTMTTTTTTEVGFLKTPTGGVAPVTDTTPTPTTTLGIAMPTEADTVAQTILGIDPSGSILHPALRGVKPVNIVPLNYLQSPINLARKRPLLGAPRSNMNPTKRTVMTLLARAKNAQNIYPVRNPNGTSGHAEPLQMITSPLYLQPPMDETMLAAAQKRNLLQGV